MKTSIIFLIVAITAVIAYPAEQNGQSAAQEIVSTLEEEQSDPIEINEAAELVRDKRQWGGGGEV